MKSKGYSHLHDDKSTVRLYTLVYCLVHEDHNDTQHYAYNEQLNYNMKLKGQKKQNKTT